MMSQTLFNTGVAVTTLTPFLNLPILIILSDNSMLKHEFVYSNLMGNK